MSELFEAHRARLEAALDACRERGAWSPFQESPSRRHHPEGARARGEAAFQSKLGRPFPLTLPGEIGRVGQEISPWTRRPLGVDYPRVDPDALMRAAAAALPAWRDVGPRERVGVCMEILARLDDSEARFEAAWATMHTAGQSFMMAFAGSGANAMDRGLEALALAWQAMSAVPESATFERAFGRGRQARLEKRYRLIPVGVAVVISCGTYPAWNAWPAVFANLATGNPVVLKPHPEAILPMALGVKIGREVLAATGHDPDLLTLAADTWEAPITKLLLDHPAAAIVDFTGGQRFGRWIEDSCRQLQVYTETAGCNGVVLESAADLDAAIEAIAESVCLFSAQMCTAAQNVFIPRGGVSDGATGARVPFADVAARFVACVDRLVADPARAAGLCGAVQTDRTLAMMADLERQAAEAPGCVTLRPAGSFVGPEHPDARTVTPLVIQAPPESDLYREERFGPVAFLIPTDDRSHALARATEDARERGAIACYAYSTDPGFIAELEERFALAGASVGINLLHQRPINFAAAYSDYHVTGLNPAGNACLADLAFVSRRFRIVQSKREVPAG